ncbi:hypothetical protein EV700_1469 [Fluviicoccus keumensis]|uniref:Uncharacterized protein n=1 Tax=Fluviicoccus keumensis TaxID=1435465 RepID=A0A4Q7Z9A1_9GAMM|nr:hypothetical protein [Fluviicoccus keumensis]RZU47078.1 hypothetical protein EV700_1469 [Fluviicoccus keumensis]
MNKIRTGFALSSITLAIMLSGCNTNSNDDTKGSTASTTTTVTVTPSLGRIKNARVVLHNPLNHNVLGSAPLNANGSAQVTVPAGTANALVEVVPDANAEYFDEATNSFQPLPASTQLRAVTPLVGPSPVVGVTPLTEAAVRFAEVQAGGAGNPITPTLIQTANTQIAQVFGINNILTPPALIGAPGDYNALFAAAANAANAYALRLAALMQHAQTQLGAGGNNQPALQLLNALAADLADGKLDHQVPTGVNVPSAFPFDDVALGTALQNALTQLVADLQALNATLPANIQNIVNGLNITITPTPEFFTTVPGTVNAALAKSYSLTFHKTPNITSPIADNQTATAVVNANGSLQINGVTLTNPYYQKFGTITNDHMLFWNDAAHNLQYILTDNGQGGAFSALIVRDTGRLVTPTEGLVLGAYTITQSSGGGGGCGTQTKLTLNDLAIYAGDYNVDIMTDPTNILLNTTLKLTTAGDVTVGNTTVHAQDVCQNTDLQNNPIGVTVYFTTGQALDFFHPPFNGITVSGDDITKNTVGSFIQNHVNIVAQANTGSITLSGASSGTLTGNSVTSTLDATIAGRFKVRMNTGMMDGSAVDLTIDNGKPLNILVSRGNTFWQANCLINPASCTGTISIDTATDQVTFTNLLLKTNDNSSSINMSGNMQLLKPAGTLDVGGATFTPLELTMAPFTNGQTSISITGKLGAAFGTGIEFLIQDINTASSQITNFLFYTGSGVDAVSYGCTSAAACQNMTVSDSSVTLSNATLNRTQGSAGTATIQLNGTLTGGL